MTRPDSSPRPARPSSGRLAPRLAILLVGLALAGCDRPEGHALVVATPWPEGDRRAIEEDYRLAAPQGVGIAWIALAPGDDPARLLPGLGIDVVLGVPAAALDQLATAGALEPVDPEATTGRPWRVARRASLGLAVAEGSGIAGPTLLGGDRSDRVALDDPRLDPVSLAWAKSRIDGPGRWGPGYAELVATAARSVRIGPAGSAAMRVAGGVASAAPTIGTAGSLDERTSLIPVAGAGPVVEGVAIVRGAPRSAEARELLTALAARGEATPVDDSISEVDPVAVIADSLLADLLGSTLVDAQDELWEAEAALESTGRPPLLVGYLADSPPWPPTSVAKLQDDPARLALVDTLARELVPDAEARKWVRGSWERPSRSIDAAWLREVAGAAGGTLAAEPRFRAWLRGEWTAWARQHYRRIAREAKKAPSP